jgi:hypothetical protein
MAIAHEAIEQHFGKRLKVVPSSADAASDQ